MSAHAIDALSLSRLFEPEVRANPYPFYARLRREDPVHWDEENRFWVLTRFEDIEVMYGDERFSRAQGLRRGFERLAPNDQSISEPVYDSFAKTMFYADPPEHTRLRGLVNSAFTPRAVDRLAPAIQRMTDELLDEVEGRGQMDIIRDLAYPLPVMVISELLGLPREDRERGGADRRWRQARRQAR